MRRQRSIRKFLVPTSNDDTLPLLRTVDLIELESDQRVFAHPLDLLADRGSAIQTVLVIGEEHGDDIWLVPPRTGEPPEMNTGEQVQTGLPRKFFDDHREFPGFRRYDRPLVSQPVICRLCVSPSNGTRTHPLAQGSGMPSRTTTSAPASRCGRVSTRIS